MGVIILLSGSGKIRSGLPDSLAIKVAVVRGCSLERPHLYLEEKMKQEQLSFYTVDMKLIRNMHNQGDDRVFSVSPQAGKDNRPFVGLIVLLNDRQYCVPLSSPKAKHASMKNGLDFHRVLDSDGKLIGVLDFNNMIPVRSDVVKKIHARINKNDDLATRHYKELISDQLTFCRQNHDVIVNKANKLYRMVHQRKTSGFIKRRCLNWTKLEEILDRYPSDN